MKLLHNYHSIQHYITYYNILHKTIYYVLDIHIHINRKWSEVRSQKTVLQSWVLGSFSFLRRQQPSPGAPGLVPQLVSESETSSWMRMWWSSWLLSSKDDVKVVFPLIELMLRWNRVRPAAEPLEHGVQLCLGSVCSPSSGHSVCFLPTLNFSPVVPPRLAPAATSQPEAEPSSCPRCCCVYVLSVWKRLRTRVQVQQPECRRGRRGGRVSSFICSVENSHRLEMIEKRKQSVTLLKEQRHWGKHEWNIMVKKWGRAVETAAGGSQEPDQKAVLTF